MVPHKYNEEWFDGSTSFISYWNSPPVNNIGKVILSSCVGGNCSDYSLHLTHLYENSSLFYILQLTERGFCNMSVSATYDTSIVVSNLTDLCNSLNSSCSGVLTCPVFNGSSIPVTPSRIIYSDALNYTFTVPVNVTSAIVQVIGAGGGGGSSRIVGTAQSGGGGGGGYGLKAVNVTAGATIPISVGLGGAGGFNSSNGLNGGLSSFNTSINATGGQGGRLNIFANCSKSAGVGGVANGTDANIKGHDGEAFCAFPNGDGGVNGYVVAYNTTVCSAYANPATCLAGYQDNNGGSSNGSGHAIGLDAILYEKNYSYTRAYFKIEELSNVYNVNGTLTSAYGLCSETFPYNCSDAGGYEYYNGVISSIGTYNFTEYYHNQVRLKALASDSFSLGNDPQWPSFSAPTSISGLSRGNTMGGAGYMGNGGGAGRGNGGGGRGGNGRVIIDLLETGESIACSTCASNNNKPCVSSANNCGLKNIGTFNCFGGCSASAPPDSATCCVPNTGASCTTTANACGITLSGKVLCDGTCEADPSTRLSVVCEGDGDIPPTTPPTCEELIDNNAAHVRVLVVLLLVRWLSVQMTVSKV
jgi:hypothetical protein